MRQICTGHKLTEKCINIEADKFTDADKKLLEFAVAVENKKLYNVYAMPF